MKGTSSFGLLNLIFMENKKQSITKQDRKRRHFIQVLSYLNIVYTDRRIYYSLSYSHQLRIGASCAGGAAAVVPSSPWFSDALMYKTLLHRTNTSPRKPANSPSMNSSVFSSCRFMYASLLSNLPWYSIPHLRRTFTIFPTKSAKNGFGLTMNCAFLLFELNS